MTAVRATFSDLRVIKTRKVVQLIMEIPIEAADHALKALGGVPRPDQERWVGIARITDEAATAPAEKPRRHMSELSRAQQAGILCNDAQFQNWLVRIYEIPVSPDQTLVDAAAEFVRTFCKVGSRADLDIRQDRGEMFDRLRTEFDAWTGRIGTP